MNDPLVSIIMPHYNRADTVQSSIESVCYQSYEHWELIIVDDASKDVEQLLALIEQINDSRIRCVRHSVNQNGAQARNTGIDHASGQYIAFLDSDDIWQREKLTIQMSAVCADVSNDILYTRLCSFNSTNPEQKMYFPGRGKRADESLGDYLFVNNGVMQTSTLLMSANVARSVKFNPNLRRHQDYDFLLRAEANGANFIFLDEVLVDYIWLGNEAIGKKGMSVQGSLCWLDEYKVYLSPSGQKGFLRKEVMKNAIRTKTPYPFFRYVMKNYGGLVLMAFSGEMILTVLQMIKHRLWRK